MTMNPDAEEELAELNKDFCEHNNWKYRKGNKEHGGSIMNMDEIELMENMLDEIVDMHNYARLAVKKLKKRRDQEQNNYKEYDCRCD